MNIKTKIIGTLIVASLLVAVLGVLAVNQLNFRRSNIYGRKEGSCNANCEAGTIERPGLCCARLDWAIPGWKSIRPPPPGIPNNWDVDAFSNSRCSFPPRRPSTGAAQPGASAHRAASISADAYASFTYTEPGAADRAAPGAGQNVAVFRGRNRFANPQRGRAR
ncbi:MAG: hypothetical protein JO279_01835 [Verrucomicrobia bacterium]|nr:hypothetical protein [Verrucomicrobiota bacterium]